jgi:hypothetical protein
MEKREEEKKTQERLGMEWIERDEGLMGRCIVVEAAADP